MLSFLFLRYLSDNYEAAAQKELGPDYPKTRLEDRRPPLAFWYESNAADAPAFEQQMRRKVHYVIHPDYLWSSIFDRARTQNAELLPTLERAFNHIENESFESRFQGLFSEINLNSEKLGRTPAERNKKLCTIIAKIAEGIAQFSTSSDILGDAYEYLIGSPLTFRRRRLRQKSRGVLHPADALHHPLAHRHPRQSLEPIGNPPPVRLMGPYMVRPAMQEENR